MSLSLSHCCQWSQPDHWSTGLDFTFSGGVTKLSFRGASGEDLAPAFGKHDQPHVDSQTQAEKA